MFRHLHREPGFYKRLFLLALPLILQNLITTSLGFVDTFMVGMLGQNELSAVTAANTPIYLLQIIILGLLSGLSVLASQYWGKGDTDSINRCMGVSLYARGSSLRFPWPLCCSSSPPCDGSGDQQRPAH